MNTLKKAFNENKLLKRIFTVIIILLIFLPSFMIAGYHNMWGRIYGLAFYFVLCSIGIYEVTSNIKIHWSFRFYYIIIGSISFIFPIHDYLLEVIFHGADAHMFLLQFEQWYILLAIALLVLPPLLSIKNKKDILFSYLIVLVMAIFLPAFGKWLWTLNSLNSLSITEKGLRLEGFGFFTVVFIGVTAALADSFALFGGMLFGRKIIKRGLAPKLSPKKSWEGAIIGFIFSAVFVAILGYFVIFQEPFLHTWQKIPFLIIAVFALPISAILGDLFFSWIKRKLGIKDFSQIIPGHGGILDRFDSTFLVTFTFIFMISLFQLL